MSAAKGYYTAETVALDEGKINTLRLTAEGKLLVDGGIGADTSALATHAKQDTGNTSLASIDADLELLKQPTKAVAVTKSDATDVSATATKGLWVGTGGDVAVKMVDDGAGGTAVTLKNVPSGTYLPGAFCRVMSANTTASDIVSFYGP